MTDQDRLAQMEKEIEFLQAAVQFLMVGQLQQIRSTTTPQAFNRMLAHVEDYAMEDQVGFHLRDLYVSIGRQVQKSERDFP